MRLFSKILKASITTVTIVSFFYSSSLASAQTTAGNTNQVSNCTTNVITNYAGSLLTGQASSLLASTLPGTFGQGVISTTALPIISAAAAEAAGLTAAGSLTGYPVSDFVSHAHLAAMDVVTAASALEQNVTKNTLDSVAYGIAQCMLTMLTDNTVKWIQGGFNGSPYYAVDTRSLFEDIAKGVSADFANQIKNIQACDFIPNFIDDLANAVTTYPSRIKIPPKIQCPFTRTNVRASDFYNSGSAQAGVFTWDLMEMALGDNGNAFGVHVLTNNELAYRQDQAKASNDQRLSWSNGFVDMLDLQNCNYPSDVKEMMDKNPPTTVGGFPLGQATISYYQKQYCPVTTPGNVIGASLMKVIGAQQDRIGFADNMNKIISALIKELTSEAVHGIFKAAGATPGVTNSSAYAGAGSTYTSGGGSISTGTAPYVSTDSYSDVTQTSATLLGSIQYQYSNTPGTMWFEWNTSNNGLILGVGSIVTNAQTYTPGVTQTSYSATISGLTSGKTYWFRAVGQKAGSASEDNASQSFSTSL